MDVLPLIGHLAWDDWNRDHIAKHGVTPDEAEDVALADPAVRKTYKNRLQLIGPTTAARLLTVIIGPAPDQAGVWYVFSARPASRPERRYYLDQKGGDHA